MAKRNSKQGRSSKKRKGASKKPDKELREDFEAFKKGVERLEELKQELNSLDTKGHEQEVAAIKSKMKNVSEIPSIERDIKRLRQKIAGRYKPKQRDNVDKKIRALEKKLDKKITSQKNTKYKNQVSRLQKEIDSLERELNKLKREQARKKELLKRVDPSVDLLANEAFDMSLNEIKVELSEKLKAREKQLQKQLQEDLKLREEAFQKKYKDVEEKYHKQYQDKVNKQLKQQVQKKFNKLLKEKLNQKKAKLTKEEREKLRHQEEKEFE
ncbi:MAG: hypothetical protein ACP5D2_05105, partial [Candidatus Nanoarchaeia archaeon]